MEIVGVVRKIKIISMRKRIGAYLTVVLFLFGMTGCSLRDPREEPATGAFESMTTYSGDYCIEVNAKNPGHPDGDNLFSTYYDWYDQENFKTDVRVEFLFYDHGLKEDYKDLENLIVVDGKSCYFITESDTKISILYEVDKKAYLKVELTANNRFDMLTGNGADLDIILEDSLSSTEFQEAFGFTVSRSENE